MADNHEGSDTPLPRSPELMNGDDTAVLVVDMQARLLPVIPDSQRLIWNVRRLLTGASILGVSRAATEQYPEKLGPTAPELAEWLDPPPAKLAFSCGACGGLFSKWRLENRHRVLVCGIETHVCIGQSVLDLLADGFSVYVAANAVAARHTIDHDVALRRMETSGATLTTVEAALFEWCREAGTQEFKQISALAKLQPPT